MKLLFLILAHDRPEDAAGLARALTDAASDAQAIIHLDANARPADFETLRRETEGAPARCRWGGYGLVQAVFNMLEEAEALGLDPDYVVLLSGACLPCRPVRQLERFLAANRGREFIEVADESWVRGGLRAERHTLFHIFDTKRWPRLEKNAVWLQSRLGVKRRFPAGLTPRFGSQWWALSGPTCRAALDYARRNPRKMAFFHKVWIPDEMVFSTLVHHLCAPRDIAGVGLTHYQFTDRGKPVVYFDDHADYVTTLDRFFFRKAAPQAATLRAHCLALAGAPDDGATPNLEAPRLDYELKARAQTNFPLAGQIFYRDQYDDMSESVLRRHSMPYIVVFGPRDMASATLARISADEIEPLGAIFDPAEVDFGPGRAALGGLRRDETALRDMHPALHLVRVRRRCAHVPVVLWRLDEQPALLADVARDPHALIVACLPHAADAHSSLLRMKALDGQVPPHLPGISQEQALAALAELTESGLDWRIREILSSASSGLEPPSNVILMPFGPDGDTALRQHKFHRSLQRTAFRDAPWFPALAHNLETAWDADFDKTEVDSAQAAL
jgi:hypothetical protein